MYVPEVVVVLELPLRGFFTPVVEEVGRALSDTVCKWTIIIHSYIR